MFFKLTRRLLFYFIACSCTFSVIAGPRYLWFGNWVSAYGYKAPVLNSGIAVSRSCNLHAYHKDLTSGACNYEQISCDPVGEFLYYNARVVQVRYEYSKECNNRTYPNVWGYTEVQGYPAVTHTSPDNCDIGIPSTKTQYPIDTTSGNKYYEELDYSSGGSFPLEFIRYFNSHPNRNTQDNNYEGLMGTWSHSYGQNIVFSKNYSGIIRSATVNRPNGSSYHFVPAGLAKWLPTFSSTIDRLESILDENSSVVKYRYVLADGTIETYGLDGRLESIRSPAGLEHTLTYYGNLITVEHTNGQTLELGFTEKHGDYYLTQQTDPSGNVTHYEWGDYYDKSFILTVAYDILVDVRLIKVIYPDTTPDTMEDNPFRIYHYESQEFPTFVTGITDENGNRISTVLYNEQSRAYVSESAGGIDHTQVHYDPSGTQVTITNSLGKQTRYDFQWIDGIYHLSHVEGLPSSNCGGSAKDYTYDGNGYLESKTDWNGNVTIYTRDARGLELSRTEAAGTPQARRVITEWHNDFRVPLRITEPGRITTFTYDDQGRELTREVQNTLP
ncbi:MAG: DUF6531 domain-containing protein [Gammaproteobacteria bacterium]|nr:DUF6531 domain-containing protein [Gammaproteobacteria bacterium]